MCVDVGEVVGPWQYIAGIRVVTAMVFSCRWRVSTFDKRKIGSHSQLVENSAALSG